MKKLLFILAVLTNLDAHSQTVIPFDSPKWSFDGDGHHVVSFKEKTALHLKQSKAFLKEAEFENGTIEFDIAFPPDRAFIGVLFRMQDDQHYEEFYIRPHQSGNPDANQYTPVFGGLSAWQLYYGERYATPISYRFHEWNHIKLLVADDILEVYFNDMESPVLTTFLKRKAAKGFLGLNNFRHENYFANFRYSTARPTIKGRPKPVDAPISGTIQSWLISDAFDESEIDSFTALPEDFKKQFHWNEAPTEPSGLLNIASVAAWSRKANTVFARVVIDSPAEHIERFAFGFSDRCRVYLNDNIVFSGADEFASRDYRFLGTMGHYDAVYLPLKKGRNELWIAISEDFGGWGIQGRIENVNLISP